MLSRSNSANLDDFVGLFALETLLLLGVRTPLLIDELIIVFVVFLKFCCLYYYCAYCLLLVAAEDITPP